MDCISCRTCGKLFPQKTRDLRCIKCRNEKYKHLCLDCNKLIWRTSIRCKSCTAKLKVKKAIGLCGNPMTEEIKNKIGRANSGSNSNFWKGGITHKNRQDRNSTKYKSWRKTVFERDNYTCQVCDKRGGRLDPHHIKPFSDYPELRFDIDNGKTLCHDCHKKTKSYGCNKKTSYCDGTVYMHVSKTCVVRHEGSNPSSST